MIFLPSDFGASLDPTQILVVNVFSLESTYQAESLADYSVYEGISARHDE